MTTDEVIDLLTLMASFDRRTVGAADVAAWGLVVGDLPFSDAQLAVVAHHAESRDWIMPADIRKRVKAMRADRLARAIPAAPPHELADETGRYQQAIRAGIRRLADGFRPPRAITGPLPGEPPKAWQEARDALGSGTQPRSAVRGLPPARHLTASQAAAAEAERTRQLGQLAREYPEVSGRP